MAAKPKPKPKYLSMLLCDYVIVDSETANKSLIGIFNTINAAKFPVRHDRMHVFVTLTNGHGDYAASLKVKSSSGKEILSLDGKVQMKDPLAVAELNFAIRGMLVPEPGRYFVEFRCDGELLVDRHFDAAVWKGPKEPGAEGRHGYSGPDLPPGASPGGGAPGRP
jgi:hypothetical protein